MARKDAITCNKKIDHNDSRSRHKIASTQFSVITSAEHFVKGVHLMSLGLWEFTKHDAIIAEFLEGVTL